MRRAAGALIVLALALLEPPIATASTVAVYQTTASLSQALAPRSPLTLTRRRPRGLPLIAVNERVRYQRFEGVGGAMTDSSAWLIWEELSPVARARLLGDLFGPDGIGLGFLRIPIGASDFTRNGRPYTYDGGRSDPGLKRFSLAHDERYVIPAVRAALALDPRLDVLATPWSPPAWMKANGLLGNLGELGTLLPSASGPLAHYLVRFIEGYRDEGIPVDAITPQNEPGVAVSYPSMNLPPAAEANLIGRYLAPALRNAHLTTKIYGYDGIWDPSYPSSLLDGHMASDLAGVAWHCYFGNPAAMSEFHQLAPRLDEIVDECSPEIRQFSTSEFEIASLRNWASVVAVWNLALDPSGGPVQSDNAGCTGCTGGVTVDPARRSFRLGAKFFQLGQLSRFVRRGASRIDSSHSVTYGLNLDGSMSVSQGLDDVAFLNPDGTKVLISYAESTVPIRFAVRAGGRFFAYTIPAGATTTFVWR
jgi:glucosylceramidase